MKVGERLVGPGEPMFVVAEIGLNHGGSSDEAMALVRTSAAAGASAVKLQSLSADRLVAADCPPPAHVAVSSLRAFFRAFELDEAAHRRIAAEARGHGLAFMSTPFDEAAVDLLVRLECDALKIASGDLTHHRLIARAAATGRPLFMSTGMSELDEVADAVRVARDAGARDVVLLHCVSAYPTPLADQNLAAIATLARTFGLPVGLSDHGTDPAAIAIAAALGACVYEKHVVRDAGGDAIDAAVSADAGRLADLVLAAERARLALGDGRKACRPAEQPNRGPSRRGLYAARDLPAGATLSAGDVVALRPAAGIGAARWRQVQGVRLVRAVPEGAPITEADVAAGEHRDVA